MHTLLFIMVFSLAVLSCGNGESSDSTDDGAVADVEGDGIAGSWVVVEVLSGEDISNTGTMYVFNEDGTMESSSGLMKIEGTWSVAGDTLKQVLGGIDMDVLFSFDGDDLVYDIINGPQTFLLKRQ